MTAKGQFFTHKCRFCSGLTYPDPSQPGNVQCRFLCEALEVEALQAELLEAGTTMGEKTLQEIFVVYS